MHVAGTRSGSLACYNGSLTNGYSGSTCTKWSRTGYFSTPCVCCSTSKVLQRHKDAARPVRPTCQSPNAHTRSSGSLFARGVLCYCGALGAHTSGPTGALWLGTIPHHRSTDLVASPFAEAEMLLDSLKRHGLRVVGGCSGRRPCMTRIRWWNSGKRSTRCSQMPNPLSSYSTQCVPRGGGHVKLSSFRTMAWAITNTVGSSVRSRGR